MSTTAPKPATTPIPVQLSEPEFDEFIFPHLSMPKRGPRCKLGYHRVFNLILWVELVASFGNLLNPLKSKEKAGIRAIWPSGACGPHIMTPRRMPGRHGATTCPAFF